MNHPEHNAVIANLYTVPTILYSQYAAKSIGNWATIGRDIPADAMSVWTHPIVNIFVHSWRR